MLLFRAMSEKEFNKLKAGETVSSDKKFSIYFRKTTTFGICFYPVTSLVDEEIIVHDLDDNRDCYIDLDEALELTGNADTYMYGVYFEVDRNKVEERHGTYEGKNSRFSITEYCTREYNKKDFSIKRVIQIKI